jgi:hypothetical protein
VGRRCRSAHAVLALAALGCALVAAGGAGAQTGTIYRCDSVDGTIVFSDLPCDDDARPVEFHAGTGGLSVVASPNDLASVAEANARYLDRLRDERAARVQAERDAQRAERLQRQAVPPMIVPVPVYVDPRRSITPSAPAAPTERMRRLQQRQDGNRRPPATEERRDEDSVLSGRQLGVRPRENDG